MTQSLESNDYFVLFKKNDYADKHDVNVVILIAIFFPSG